MMCVHLYLISKRFDHSKKKSYTHEAVTTHFPLPTPRPYKPLTCFLPLQICPFWTFHINEMIQGTAFYVWLLSLDIMFARCTHLSVLFCGWIIFHCMDIPHLFIHCLVAGHLWCWGWESVNQLPELPTKSVKLHQKGALEEDWKSGGKKRKKLVHSCFLLISCFSQHHPTNTFEPQKQYIFCTRRSWIQLNPVCRAFFFFNACRLVLSNFLEDKRTLCLSSLLKGVGPSPRKFLL